jgi:DNA repair protein RecO (recombination protein O)
VKQLVTQAIVLGRTDYGEADRILTLLTPEYGKLRVIAKGVRRIKSKLAGGIELFSISEITFIKGRGEVGTLVSSRLIRHYERIVGDLERTMTGYELMKRLHTATQDDPEEAYFTLLQQTFEALNDPAISLVLIRFWFGVQLLRIEGRMPNLQTDTSGQPLDSAARYAFDTSHMAFYQATQGQFSASHIKVLRISFADNPPVVLQQIQGLDTLLAVCGPFVTMLSEQRIA